ncbi:MAG TPA: DUF11 domain-containing protein, partial [Verrucomicrobiae bacterium]|nr:DUF11 domain-containing protein [Verrucomicrobiae bacterium]
MTSFSPRPTTLDVRRIGCRGGALLASLAIILLLPGMVGGQVARVSPVFRDSMAAATARDLASEKVPDFSSVKDAPFLRGEFLPKKAPKTTAAPEPIGLWGEPVAEAPQTLSTGFAGISLLDQFNDLGVGSLPPDTMGAVGPDHFVVVINGSVAVFEKSDGTRVSHVSLDSFFTSTFDSVNYPRNGAFDPRVLFDRASGRWIASALERGEVSRADNHVILAVSQTSDPTGGWYKYLVEFGVPDTGAITHFSDYQTLGVDGNGVYLAARIFPSVGSSTVTIAAMQKVSLLSGAPSTVTYFDGITDMYSTPQPAHNFDAVSSSDPAWFVSTSRFLNDGDIYYRKLTWSGGVPSLDGSAASINSSSIADPILAPASGSTTDVSVGDVRLLMAVIRDQRLWTSRNVGVNSSGTSSSADRTGCEWFEIDVNSGSPTIVQSGRVYDSAASNPRFYYFPAIMVNGQGHAAMGFSGSKGDEFVGAYFTGRLVNHASGTMGVIELLKAGEASYTRVDGATPPRNRWGDYSYTTLDPADDMTLWTIQEYAATGTANNWATWINELRSPAPTLAVTSDSDVQGAVEVTVNLTGTGIYDPGAGFPNRLNIQITGGAPNGISNETVTFVDATSADVTFDIAANAAVGARDIVLTNPDGQTATITDGFDVLAANVDIAVTQSATPPPVYLGSNYVYSITVTNKSTADAGAVVLTNTLPAGVTMVSASSSQGACSETAGVVACALGDLAAGLAATLSIEVTAAAEGSQTNTVEVALANSDPVPADNTSELVTTVLPVSDLEIAVAVAP